MMIRECCVCGKREFEGHWTRDRSAEGRRGVSHVYCPGCFEGVMDKIDRHLDRQHGKRVYTVVEADLS